VRQWNRFNGLFGGGETVETVIELFPADSIPLKWGANESTPVDAPESHELLIVRQDHTQYPQKE
jgi:hypothetical protein